MTWAIYRLSQIADMPRLNLSDEKIDSAHVYWNHDATGLTTGCDESETRETRVTSGKEQQEMVPVRGYEKGSPAGNIEFFGPAG